MFSDQRDIPRQLNMMTSSRTTAALCGCEREMSVFLAHWYL